MVLAKIVMQAIIAWEEMPLNRYAQMDSIALPEPDSCMSFLALLAHKAKSLH
jgi:hypothetical protein